MTFKNVHKSTCWEPKIAFLITTPTMIGQLYKHGAGNRINWKLVNGPNCLPTVECQPALRRKFEFNVCACVWCACLWTTYTILFTKDDKIFHRIP